MQQTKCGARRTLGGATQLLVWVVLPLLLWETSSGSCAVSSAIEQKYSQLKGASLLLGAALGPEQATKDGKGRFRLYQNGAIYWSPSTGAHEIHGAIYKKWSQLHAERSLLGFPTGDVGTLVVPQENGHGYCSRFEHGMIYWIYMPNVKRHSTDYEQIQFRESDKIIVSATGCVQTGGSGRTWKRYVNPRGPNADRFYHGLIWIPGAMREMDRLQRVIGKTLSIPAKLDYPVKLYLRLGYEDDDYGDNGYWGRDEGTGNQCKGLGNAEVTITIIRQGAA